MNLFEILLTFSFFHFFISSLFLFSFLNCDLGLCLNLFYQLFLFVVFLMRLVLTVIFPMFRFLETGEYKTLGSISIDRTYDGNYTGNFNPKVDADVLWHEMRGAANEGLHYRIRAGTGKNAVEAFNEPVSFRWNL